MYYLLKLQNVVIYIVAIISYHVFSPQLSSDNTYMLVARLNHANASVLGLDVRKTFFHGLPTTKAQTDQHSCLSLFSFCKVLYLR